MVKLYKDDEHGPDTNRNVVCYFYKHFGLVKKIEMVEEGDDAQEKGVYVADSDYKKVTLSCFKKRNTKRQRKTRRPVIVRTVFEKTQPVTEKNPEEDDEEFST